MKVATWNINSLRVRLDRVLGFLERHEPDILCLQETKVANEEFPLEAFQMRGYHLARHGQKTYNGVAIVSRDRPQDVERGFPRDPVPDQARVISATYGDVRVTNAYVVNGKHPGDPAYQTKLAWLQALSDHVPAQQALVVGDFNVAPTDADVHDPDAWRGSILCTDQERAALGRFFDKAYADIHRAIDPEAGFSWWDYRGGGFARDHGLRIDLQLGTPDVARRATAAYVDREERKQGDWASKPSDHAPVIVEFD